MKKKNYFRTILIALALITGLSAATMAQTLVTMKTTASKVDIRANWSGDGTINANGTPLTNNTVLPFLFPAAVPLHSQRQAV